ncbi:MAG: SufE family protein [Flavobacteriales bacterium]|nr:SufE family protein [Flavobacteriales bacterium]
MDRIEERQKEIIEEFELFDDWMDKYSLIIDLGKELAPLPESDHVDENLIKGCQSKVWLTAQEDGGQVTFLADSDAIITKGLISLLIKVLSEARPEEIVKADLHFIQDIGLHEHLSPTRSNGLASMVQQMKMFALALTAK